MRGTRQSSRARNDKYEYAIGEDYYCVSRRLREEGFEFQHPSLETALQELYR